MKTLLLFLVILLSFVGQVHAHDNAEWTDEQEDYVKSLLLGNTESSLVHKYYADLAIESIWADFYKEYDYNLWHFLNDVLYYFHVERLPTCKSDGNLEIVQYLNIFKQSIPDYDEGDTLCVPAALAPTLLR